jgi:hypothetical protein
MDFSSYSLRLPGSIAGGRAGVSPTPTQFPATSTHFSPPSLASIHSGFWVVKAKIHAFLFIFTGFRGAASEAKINELLIHFGLIPENTIYRRISIK